MLDLFLRNKKVLRTSDQPHATVTSPGSCFYILFYLMETAVLRHVIPRGRCIFASVPRSPNLIALRGFVISFNYTKLCVALRDLTT